MMTTFAHNRSNNTAYHSNTWPNRCELIPAVLLLFGFAVSTSTYAQDQLSKLSGREIMDEVYRHHEQHPYVFEEQTMILVDSAGNRDTRKLRRFSRMESREFARYLLVFDDPPEIRGVGLLTTRLSSGKTETGIYLPSIGPRLIYSIGDDVAGNFLGTDFSVQDLIPDILDDYIFQRQEDENIDKVDYFVISVTQRDQNALSPSYRRHYIRQDNFYITRTDTFDRQGRLHKRFTRHDLKQLGKDMWRANMLLMQDFKTRHQSLIKITRRIFSRDYVPEAMFSLEWLVENRSIPISKEGDTANTSEQEALPMVDKHQVSSNVGELH
jgi:hypothetical protein